MKRFFIPGVVVLFGIACASGILIAHAQTPQISFPVPELGNCGSQEACKAYCNNPEHISECVAFGEKNNLISKEDAERAKEFADVLKGEGPGQCRNKVDCETYCDDILHAEECVAFAEKHNFMKLEDLAEAKMVAKALKEGGQLPGQCKNKGECEKYCSDSANSEECLSFGEKMGILSKEEAEQARKVLPLIAKGESPGKCKTKAECESYCALEGNFSECVAFAEKAGIISAEELELAKKTGGKGPGGCRSKEACDAFCNIPENQDTCFAFAKEHNIIPEDKLKEIEEGMGRLRAGISQMPEEMVSCLKEKIGQDVVQKIEAGTLAPGPLLGEQVKSCVESFMPKIKEKMEKGLSMADPATLKCLEDGLGGKNALDAIRNGGAPTPEMGDVMKKCFGQMKEDGLKKIREALSTIPPEMYSCVENKLGKDLLEKIKLGADVEIGPEVGGVFEECGKAMQEAMRRGMEEGMNQVPPEMQDMVRQKIESSGIQEKIERGEIRSAEEAQRLIQEQMQGITPPMPQGAPEGGGMPAPTPEMCAKFKMAPSCDFVPADVRDLCKKCM